jgi:basic membrane protein A and related proteins
LEEEIIMKKYLAFSLILALLFSLTALVACSNQGTGTYDMALVTDVGNIDDKSFNEGAWNGVKAYAKANKITYAYYRPSEDTTAARVETIKAAIDKGAKTVVCPGYLFEDAIYEVQTQYPNVQFLLLDGEPHTADYKTYKTEANVHCILYKEEQAGYLAGYAAVMDGYRKLGFLGGMDVPAVIRYGFGYIQGAEAAAKSLGLKAGDVTIKYWYCGGFKPTDDIKTKMSGWYTEGTEVVFSCGGGIYVSAVAAAVAAGKKVIGVDVDQASINKVIITSAMKELTTSVKLALPSLYANGGKWDAAHAGKTVVLGAAEDCVGLPTASGSWRLTKWKVADYNTLFASLKSGSIVVSNDIKNKPAVTICTVSYQN